MAGRAKQGRSRMRILVTGGAGFLGSNLASRLLTEGHTVVVIDNLSMGCLENLAGCIEHPDFSFIESDVTEKATFDEIGQDIDCIVHLAAFKIPRYGKALDTLQINYRGAENTLEFARRIGCKCVLASTSDVYGRNPELPSRLSKRRQAVGDEVVDAADQPSFGGSGNHEMAR